jgi:hypothetical protein
LKAAALHRHEVTVLTLSIFMWFLGGTRLKGS